MSSYTVSQVIEWFDTVSGDMKGVDGKLASESTGGGSLVFFPGGCSSLGFCSPSSFAVVFFRLFVFSRLTATRVFKKYAGRGRKFFQKRVDVSENPSPHRILAGSWPLGGSRITLDQ